MRNKNVQYHWLWYPLAAYWLYLQPYFQTGNWKMVYEICNDSHKPVIPTPTVEHRKHQTYHGNICIYNLILNGSNTSQKVGTTWLKTWHSRSNIVQLIGLIGNRLEILNVFLKGITWKKQIVPVLRLDRASPIWKIVSINYKLCPQLMQIKALL